MEKPVFLAEKTRGQNLRQPKRRAETWKMQQGGAPNLPISSARLSAGPWTGWTPSAPRRSRNRTEVLSAAMTGKTEFTV